MSPLVLQPLTSPPHPTSDTVSSHSTERASFAFIIDILGHWYVSVDHLLLLASPSYAPPPLKGSYITDERTKTTFLVNMGACHSILPTIPFEKLILRISVSATLQRMAAPLPPMGRRPSTLLFQVADSLGPSCSSTSECRC